MITLYVCRYCDFQDGYGFINVVNELYLWNCISEKYRSNPVGQQPLVAKIGCGQLSYKRVKDAPKGGLRRQQ